MPENQRIFTGVKFAVDLVQAPTRDGGSVQRELVVHPGAVVILGVLDDGRIVLIRNRRFAVAQTLLELPAGTLEPGEDPAVCAGRELIEETGYEASHIEPLCRFFTSPGICTEQMHAFVATGLRHVGQALEETEQITVVPTPPEEVLAMIQRNEIRDGKTIAAVLHHHVFGKR